MEAIQEKVSEAKCLLDYTARRIKQMLGVILLFTGETGKGKSYAGIRFLELWYKKQFDEDFPAKHICENLQQAILLVKNFKRIGEGILVEELSVHAGSRDSLTKQNKLWNQFLDTCRIKQAVIVANCPHISFIDKHFQMMCQVWVNCLGVDFRKKRVVARPLWLQTSPHKNEPYKHRFVGDDGYEIDMCYFNKPGEEVLKEYDAQKLESADELYDEISLKLRHDRIKKLKELGQKALSKREMQCYEYYLNGYSPTEGAEEMKIDRDNYYKFLNLAKKKLKQPEYAKIAKEIGKKTIKN